MGGTEHNEKKEKVGILICGGGGIGRTIGAILRARLESDRDFIVYIADANPAQAQAAADFANSLTSDADLAKPIAMEFEGISDELESVLGKVVAVIDALPGSQAPRVAQWAKDHSTHYLNLTEYLAETAEVLKITDGANTIFPIQCGLAPGFINVLGNHLLVQALKTWGVDGVESLNLKVGALSKSAVGPHQYCWTWSPIGVATEYCHPAYILRNGIGEFVDSVKAYSPVVIDGVAYEEAITSGGTADLPDALQNRCSSLVYQTLRWPGHWRWVLDLKERFGDIDREEMIAKLESEMLDQVPHVEDDLVVIYAAVVGLDSDGVRRCLEIALRCEPIHIGGITLRSIQSTTACGLLEVLRLVLDGTHDIRPGPLTQSMVPTDAFLTGPYVSLAYPELAQYLSPNQTAQEVVGEAIPN